MTDQHNGEQPKVGEYRRNTPRDCWNMWNGEAWVHLSREMTDFMDQLTRYEQMTKEGKV